MTHPYLIDYETHRVEADEAYRLFKAMAPGCGRVPGMDTVIRLAVRIEHGRTVQEAAAREYLYRWHLALRSVIFDVPHALGV